MNIHYFFRNKEAGYSINKVFKTISDEIVKTESVKEFYLPNCRLNPISIILNGIFVYINRNKNGINHIIGGEYYLAYFLPKKIQYYQFMILDFIHKNSLL